MFPIAQYIPFAEKQKLRAGAVDLEEFLRSRGERLIRSGKDKRMDNVAWATSHEVMNGTGDGTFAQVAAIVERFCEKVAK